MLTQLPKLSKLTTPLSLLNTKKSKKFKEQDVRNMGEILGLHPLTSGARMQASFMMQYFLLLFFTHFVK